MKKVLFGAAALMAATVLGASQAQAAAVTFDSVGDSTVQSFFLDPDGAGGLDPLTATATLTVNAISDSTLELYVELENTTNSPTYANAGLASVGFSIDPNADSVSGDTTGGAWDTGTDSDKFDGFSLEDIPSLKLVEICAWAGNNCNGGGQGSLLAENTTDFFRIVLTFDPDTDGEYILNDFGVKFQTSAGSFEFYSYDTERTTDNPGGTSTGPTQGPEPALLSMLGVGLAGAAYRLRRRR